MLKLYNSIQKRDYDRFDGTELLLCPRQRFVPFGFMRDHVANDFVQTISLVNTAGTVTDISAYFDGTGELLTGTPSWTNGTGGAAYDTLTATGDNITSAILTPANPTDAWAYSNILYFNASIDDVFYVEATLTLNAGVAPDVYIGPSTEGASEKSNVYTLASGANKFMLKVTEAGYHRLYFRTNIGDTTNYSCTVAIRGSVRPFSYEKTSKDYLIYKGLPLDTLIQPGIYSLKITDKISTYYSDWFCVKDIMPNLVSAWTNDGMNPYNTFDYVSATRSFGATETSSNNGEANSSTFAVIQGETIIVSGCLRMISGQIPHVGLYNSSGNVLIASSVMKDGDNIIELVSDRTATAYIKIYVTSNANFSFIPVTVYRPWGNFIRIKWDNTKDIRDSAGKFDLLYSEGLTQEIFLDAYLNTPVHESNEVGEEKDGVFIAEKTTATPRQRIVAYVPRSTYEGLMSLPLHDTITIWDEVGNKYLIGGAALRAAGNIEVNFDFNYFELGTLEIIFTESSYYSTENIDNVT